MSILNKALIALVIGLALAFGFTAYKASKLEGKVNVLTFDLNAAVRHNESLSDALELAKADAAKTAKLNNAQSTARAKAKRTVRAALQEGLNESPNEVPVLIPDGTLNRLQRLADEANRAISTAGNTK